MMIVLLRTLLIYLVIMAALRLTGKRQLAQLQPGEFAITILISNIATLPLQDTDIPLIGGIIPILVLVSLEVLISALTRKSHGARKFCYGSEKVLIEKGKLNLQTMKDLRFTADDLMGVLRAQGIFDLQDVDFAIVQTNGNVNVYPVFSARPVTNRDLKLTPENTETDPISLVVASEGAPNEAGLKALGLSRQWLFGLIKAKGKRIDDVFLLTAKSRNDTYIVWQNGATERSKEA